MSNDREKRGKKTEKRKHRPLPFSAPFLLAGVEKEERRGEKGRGRVLVLDWDY